MTNLYDILRQVVTASVDTASKEASDELEYAASAILDAIRHETRHVKDELDKAAATVVGIAEGHWGSDLLAGVDPIIPDNDAPMWEGLCNLGDVGKVTSCRESQCPDCRIQQHDDARDDQTETSGATVTLTVGTRLTLTADERLVLINALIARRQNATVFAREEHLDLSHVAAICDELLHRIGDQP